MSELNEIVYDNCTLSEEELSIIGVAVRIMEKHKPALDKEFYQIFLKINNLNDIVKNFGQQGKLK